MSGQAAPGDPATTPNVSAETVRTRKLQGDPEHTEGGDPQQQTTTTSNSAAASAPQPGSPQADAEKATAAAAGPEASAPEPTDSETTNYTRISIETLEQEIEALRNKLKQARTEAIDERNRRQMIAKESEEAEQELQERERKLAELEAEREELLAMQQALEEEVMGFRKEREEEFAAMLAQFPETERERFNNPEKYTLDDPNFIYQKLYGGDRSPRPSDIHKPPARDAHVADIDTAVETGDRNKINAALNRALGR